MNLSDLFVLLQSPTVFCLCPLDGDITHREETAYGVSRGGLFLDIIIFRHFLCLSLHKHKKTFSQVDKSTNNQSLRVLHH